MVKKEGREGVSCSAVVVVVNFIFFLPYYILYNSLSLRLNKKYPYVVPKIKLKNVQGLSKSQQQDLLQKLNQRAIELSKTGCVMMVELVQVTEDYLLEHNRDPKTSAWEQMKAREAMEQEKEQRLQAEQQEEINRLIDIGGGGERKSPKTSIATIHSSGSGGDLSESQSRIMFADGTSSDVKREMNRQMEALEDASRLKQGLIIQDLAGDGIQQQLIDDDNFDDNYSDESDNDDELPPAPETWGGGSSRYKADFIELGILGRGGGGEVVKVRNRLDRRIYAIKKIILESERGKFAKAGAIQNRKLRREVTTISRMTHKNIVRYYQAWVEGEVETIEEATIEIDDKIDENNDESDEWKTDHANDDKDSSNSTDEANPGYWTKPPISKFFSEDSSDSESSDKSSENDETNDNDDNFVDLPSSPGRNSLHSASFENLLEHENDHGFQNSPLLAGLGFQSTVYKDYSEKRNKIRSHSISSDDDDLIWDESSSVKVGSNQSQRILYIQMEYCSTTLRKLIDDGKLIDENEIWRLIRQIIEALVYIHKLNIIHRDLKPGEFSTIALT